MKCETNEHERMESITAEGPGFLQKIWLPLSAVIFWMVVFAANWIPAGAWDLKKTGLVILQLLTAIPVYYLIRYLVSGFADGVWVDDESILFKKDGKTEKTALSNIEELKSFYYLLGFPFNSRQYVVKIKLSEPIGMGNRIRFFIRSPVGNSGPDKAILEKLVERIKKVQCDRSNQTETKTTN
ncbi:MAG: hypothetical protein ABIK07_12725 [Planctomycetota bacterium]